jgi:hypothetical protein
MQVSLCIRVYIPGEWLTPYYDPSLILTRGCISSSKSLASRAGPGIWARGDANQWRKHFPIIQDVYSVVYLVVGINNCT